MNAARVIVTGPTSGIGKEQLALRGAEVILACRDPQRGEETAEAIREHATAAQPVVMPVDTSNQASISDFPASTDSATTDWTYSSTPVQV